MMGSETPGVSEHLCRFTPMSGRWMTWWSAFNSAHVLAQRARCSSIVILIFTMQHLLYQIFLICSTIDWILRVDHIRHTRLFSHAMYHSVLDAPYTVSCLIPVVCVHLCFHQPSAPAALCRSVMQVLDVATCTFASPVSGCSVLIHRMLRRAQMLIMIC